MIDSGQPLRHAGVVGVFRLERELQESSRGQRRQSASIQTAVAAYPLQNGSPIRYQAQTKIDIRGPSFRERRRRRTVDRPHKVIIEVRSPHGYLRLFK